MIFPKRPTLEFIGNVHERRERIGRSTAAGPEQDGVSRVFDPTDRFGGPPPERLLPHDDVRPAISHSYRGLPHPGKRRLRADRHGARQGWPPDRGIHTLGRRRRTYLHLSDPRRISPCWKYGRAAECLSEGESRRGGTQLSSLPSRS